MLCLHKLTKKCFYDIILFVRNDRGEKNGKNKVFTF